jgi:hypothetical protein
MADTEIIDLDRFRRNRPALFRTPDEMARMRIEQAARDLPADSPVRNLLRSAEAASPVAAAIAPPHFGSYAPDPDADYESGRQAGWRACEQAQLVQPMPDRRWTRTEQVVRGLILLGLPIAVFAFLLFVPRS